MELELYKEVVITRDVPEENLKAGDVAMYIDHLKHPSGGEDGAILEVFNAIGDTIGVVTVPISAIAPLSPELQFTVRRIG